MTYLWEKYIEHISVSQVKTHERSPRRWALEKLVRLPTCDSPYTAIGKQIHDDIEQHLKGERELEDMSPHAQRLLELWREMPHGHDITGVETEISIKIAEDLPPFKGFIDVYGPGFILDHKTSGSKRYFLKPDTLATDIQMMVYAYWYFTTVGLEEEELLLVHNQYCYKIKNNPLTQCAVTVTRAEVMDAIEQLRDKVRWGIVKTIEEFDQGLLPVGGCGDCRCAFGPNSCEYAPICDGYATDKEYLEIHAKLREDQESVYISDMVDALHNQPLTEKEDDDIIVEKVHEEPMPKILDLTTPVKKARDKFKNINNTWDKRDAMTKAVMDFVLKDKPDLVLLPAHFIGGTVDPEYAPIVTQLKENNILTAVRL